MNAPESPEVIVRLWNRIGASASRRVTVKCKRLPTKRELNDVALFGREKRTLEECLVVDWQTFQPAAEAPAVKNKWLSLNALK